MMKSYIKRIENRLNECQKKALQDIFEPTVVGVPLADSRRNVCILPDIHFEGVYVKLMEKCIKIPFTNLGERYFCNIIYPIFQTI